ncbi:MAG: hypothetical protein C0394_10910 [Syntrophus sp. (in: bacteria)]|nr:hypothetical protein [Syntrophus sp. (in: bacteria)]
MAQRRQLQRNMARTGNNDASRLDDGLEQIADAPALDQRRLVTTALMFQRVHSQAGQVQRTGVEVKKPVEYNIHHFEKVGQRKSMACAVASMAALLRLSPSGVIEAARLAWGSVGPTVVTAAAVEATLIGEKLSQETLATAAARIRQIVAPIDDLRASADYRRTVSGNLLLRLLDARAL